MAGLRGAGVLPPYAVVGCSIVFFWSLSARTAIQTLMPSVAAELSLSSSAAGVALAAIAAGNSVGLWSAGWLPGDRRIRIIASAVCSLVGAALFSFSRDLTALIGTGLILGLSTGVYLPLGLSIITDAGGPHRKALYVSVQEAAAAIAMFGGAAYVGVAIGFVGWREAVLLWCPVGLLAIAAFYRVRTPDGGSSGSRHGAGPRSRVTLAYCALAFLCSSLLLGGLLSALPLVMVRGWGVDQAEAASVLGYTRIAGLFGAVLAGLRADRWGHVRVLRGLQIAGLAGCLAMSAGGYGPLFVAGLIVLSVASSGMVTVQPAVVANAFPASQRERAMSIAIGAGSVVGTVASPPAFGMLVDIGLPTAPMAIAAAITLAALLFVGRIPAHQAGAEDGEPLVARGG